MIMGIIPCSDGPRTHEKPGAHGMWPRRIVHPAQAHSKWVPGAMFTPLRRTRGFSEIGRNRRSTGKKHIASSDEKVSRGGTVIRAVLIKHFRAEMDDRQL